MAMDKILETLPFETDLRTAQDIADSMLDRIGFGAKPIQQGNLTINQQNNMVALPNATRNEIAEARALLAQRASSLGVGVVINGESLPIALPRESLSSVGEDLSESDLPSSEGSYTERKVGAQV
jgi:hypothetical protein